MLWLVFELIIVINVFGSLLNKEMMGLILVLYEGVLLVEMLELYLRSMASLNSNVDGLHVFFVCLFIFLEGLYVFIGCYVCQERWGLEIGGDCFALYHFGGPLGPLLSKSGFYLSYSIYF